VALKYTIMLNGVTQLIMTKADVLDSFDTIKVAVTYKVNGEETQEVPYDIDAKIEPIYKDFKGWNKSIAKIKKLDELPAELMNYIKFIETETKVPITIVSVGPDREATINRPKS